MTSFSIEIFFYEFFILCRIHQTERLENIIEIFPLRPLMEEIQAIIPAKDAVDVLILAAVPNNWARAFEFLGKSHSKRVEIPQGTIPRNATNPMSSGICKLIQINDAGAVFSGHDFIPGENSFEIGNFQKINPLEEIKVAQRFVDEFRFPGRELCSPGRFASRASPQNIAPRIGMLLNGLFSPSRSPSPRFARSPFLDFFSPIPRPQFPTIGGGR